MKPMLGLSLHVSMPACVQALGACADAGAAKISGTSKAAANRTLVMTTPVVIICDCRKAGGYLSLGPSLTRRWFGQTTPRVGILIGRIGPRGNVVRLSLLRDWLR